MYPENYKTLQRQIKGALDKCREIPCSWTETFNLNKTALFNN